MLTFAHLTDIHLSVREESWGTLGSLAETLLNVTIAELNAMQDLDFVLFTGDLLDGAIQEELDRLSALLAQLEKPWHFVPGNHDGYIDPSMPEAFAPHQGVSKIDPRLATPRPDAQHAYWRREVAPGVQLIGLDSRLPDHWNGEITTQQLAWLQDQLVATMNDLVIIAVHHPVHLLHPKDREPYFSNFVVDNGIQVEALLDAYPNVKLVLAGHHHAHQIKQQGERLHVNTAALSGYPCVYRILRLAPVDEGWHVQIETRSPADEGQRKRAYDKMVDSTSARKFNPDYPEAWPEFAAGRPSDQSFDQVLKG